MLCSDCALPPTGSFGGRPWCSTDRVNKMYVIEIIYAWRIDKYILKIPETPYSTRCLTPVNNRSIIKIKLPDCLMEFGAESVRPYENVERSIWGTSLSYQVHSRSVLACTPAPSHRQYRDTSELQLACLHLKVIHGVSEEARECLRQCCCQEKTWLQHGPKLTLASQAPH